jgi:raffinose/stachyose/melibiose transport system substrate-binding protein
MRTKTNWLKALIMLLIVFFTVSLIWAEGEGQGQGQGQAATPKTITLTVWDFKYGDPNTAAVMDEVEGLFMKANPNIKIDHVGQPNEEYYNLLRAAVASGQGPDIAMVHGGAQGWEFDQFQVKLDDYIASYRSQISEASWTRGAKDEKLANGIKVAPLTMQGFGFYYNKALFKKAGLDPNKAPSNWADFLAACAKLKAAGITPITTGFDYTICFMQRCEAANIYGPNMGGLATGKENFSNPAFKKFMQMLVELRDKEYLDPNGAGIPFFMDGIEMFKAGKGAIFCGLLSDIAHWKDFSDANGKENIGYFPSINFPEAKYKNMQTIQPIGIGWTIMKWSENKDAAAKFIQFYLTGKGAEVFASKLGALHPNIKLDTKAIGYPALDQMLAGMSDKTIQADFVQLFPSTFENEMIRFNEMLLVTGELTVDQFAAKMDELAKME